MMLKLLILLKPIFIKMNIDFNRLYTLVEYKLMMEDRATTPMQSMSKKILSNKWNQFLSHALLGFFTALIISSIDNIALAIGLLMFIVLIMMVMLTVTSVSSTLLDVNDKAILHTKPMPTSVITLSKVIVIIRSLVLHSLAISALSLLVIAFKYGVIACLMTVLFIVYTNIIVLIVSSLLYVIVLKFYDGERLKDILTYVQLGLTIVSTMGYLFLSSSLTVTLEKITVYYTWYHVFLPPFWFMSWFETSSSLMILILKVMGLVFPIILLLWYILFLTPRFEGYLIKLEHTQTGREKVTRERLLTLFSKKVTSNEEERSGFIFSIKHIKRDRKLRQIIFVNMAFIILYPLIGFLQKSPNHLLLYFGFGMMFYSHYYLQFGESPDARWVFKMFPHSHYFYFKRGVQKAFIFTLLSVVILLLGILNYFLSGLNILLLIINSSLLTIILIRFDIKNIDGVMYHSVALEAMQKERSVKIGLAIKYMLLPVLYSALHHMLSQSILFSCVLAVFYLIVIYYIYFKDTLNKKLRDKLPLD